MSTLTFDGLISEGVCATRTGRGCPVRCGPSLLLGGPVPVPPSAGVTNTTGEYASPFRQRSPSYQPSDIRPVVLSNPDGPKRVITTQ